MATTSEPASDQPGDGEKLLRAVGGDQAAWAQVLAPHRKCLRRFQTEARSAVRLHHTNIVPVFDWLSEQKDLSEQYARELADFRAEAEAVLAGPVGELPADVFAPGT